MEQSKFQFSNPHIESIDFRVNKSKTSSNNMPIHIEVESDVDDDAKKSLTKLNLVVGEIDSETNELKTSVYFNGVIAAEFVWTEEINNPDGMLKVSGGAVLLSYIRPVLANLTMQAGMKPLNIPFINFAKEN